MVDTIQWPKNISLSVDHNQHLISYATIEEYLEMEQYKPESWPNGEYLRRSIETGEVWTIHWYPDTPVGFCSMWFNF